MWGWWGGWEVTCDVSVRFDVRGNWCGATHRERILQSTAANQRPPSNNNVKQSHNQTNTQTNKHTINSQAAVVHAGIVHPPPLFCQPHPQSRRGRRRHRGGGTGRRGLRGQGIDGRGRGRRFGEGVGCGAGGRLGGAVWSRRTYCVSTVCERKWTVGFGHGFHCSMTKRAPSNARD